MSVENLDGNGLADQPSIIYAFEKNENDEVEIRELSRSGFGSPGSSPGDVIERESTKSSPTIRLPELELPGRRGLWRDDCGDDIPAFACTSDDGCGSPVYVGRTCASPVCERDWPAAVKTKTVRTAGKLEGFRRALYARYDGRRDIDFNHVVASLPSVLVDSDEPFERVLLILKTLLEEQWNVDGFVAIYHPYRIKKTFRKDQYDHGGESGEGEMTWKEVLDRDDPEQCLTFEPHFHTFFPAPRGSFDYLTTEAVEDDTGWLFHRITKGDESNNISVEDFDDLVHQLTYCFSHAGVRETSADRFELASRMKGDLYNCYIPEGVEEEALALFCDAAPKLLGTRFTNLSKATCDAEVSGTSDSDGSEITGDTGPVQSGSECDDCQGEVPSDHPLADVWNPTSGVSSSPGGGDSWPGGTLDAGTGGEDAEQDEWGGDGWSASSDSLRAETADSADSESAVGSTSPPSNSDPESVSPITDDREACGGTLNPINEAADRLEDEEWCQQAEHVSGLRTAVAEWRRRTDGEEELPWTDEDGDDGYPGVIQGD